jgi:WD40 repeat protein
LWQIELDGSATCISTLEEKKRPYYNEMKILSIEFHQKLPFLVACFSDDDARLWYLESNGTNTTFVGSIGLIDVLFLDSVAFHPTLPTLIVTSHHGFYLYKFSQKEIKLIEKLQIPNIPNIPSYKSYIKFHQSLPFLAINSEDNNIELYRYSDNELKLDINHITTIPSDFKYNYNSIVFHPTLPLLAIISNNYLKFWRFELDSSTTTCFETLNREFNCIAFHPTLPFLATSEFLESGVELWILKPHEMMIKATSVVKLNKDNNLYYPIAFHPNLPLMAAGTFMEITLWKL